MLHKLPDQDDLNEALKQLKAHESLLGQELMQMLSEIIAQYQNSFPSIIPKQAQRKHITVLFADISGFTALSETMDAEDVASIINQLWERLDAQINRYGGHIDKHIGDAVMALWGVEQAREDDAERAVRAGLAMQDALLEFSVIYPESVLKLRVGVHSGPAVLGYVGTTAEFTAMGDTVNTASRLEHAAPLEGVLISHDTYQLIRGMFICEEQKPLKVKGKVELLRTYTVVHALEHAFRLPTRGIEGVQTRMIGRDEEFQKLQVACNEAIYRQYAGLISLTGEAGIGKSRLLDELEQWLKEQPHTLSFLKGRSTQEMQYRPYALLREILFSHWQVSDHDLTSEALVNKIVEKVQALQAGLSRTQIHCICVLLGIKPGTGTDRVTGTDKGKRQEHAEAALIQYVQALAKTVVLTWLVEDVQWADSSTLGVLSRICQSIEGSAMLVIATARPDFWQKHPGWGGGLIHHVPVKLSTLTSECTRELIKETLQKVDKIPPKLENLLIEHSHGNPLYMEEILLMFIADGTLITTPGKWFINPTKLSQVRLPPTLTGILQARLENLPPIERKLLQQAAIVGGTFWTQAVSYLQQQMEECISDAEAVWQKLMERDLIRREEDSLIESKELNCYSFCNPILREVVYESVLKSDRRAYHAHIAQWLIDQSDEQCSDYFSLIAEHLEKAQKNNQAIVYLRHAGEQAQQTYGFQESIHFFKRALGLLAFTENHEERVQLTREIGRAMVNVGQWDNAKTWFQDSLELAKQSAIPQQIVSSLQELTQLAQERGEYQEALARIDEGLEIIKKHKLQLGADSAVYFQKAREGLTGFLSSATDKAAVLARQQAEQAKKKLEKAFSGIWDRFKGEGTEPNDTKTQDE